MLDYILELDTQLFLWLNNLGAEEWDQFWIKVTSKTFWIPFYVLIVLAFGFVYKPKSFAWSLLFIAITVLATDQGSVHLFKEQFMRLRPCKVQELLEQIRLVKGCGGKFGFISSHASNTFGLAMFVGLCFRRSYPWVIYVMLAWALLVTYSRIYVGVHYPLDVICGAQFGAFCGASTYRLFSSYFKPELR